MNEQQGYPGIFFILGRARSGTTLLRSMLDEHQGMLIPPECAFLNNLYSKYGKRRLQSEADVMSFIGDLKSQPAYGFLHVDEDRLRNALLRDQPDYAHACLQVYLSCRPMMPKADISLVGDKNPHYALFVKRLQQVYPHARFIHIVRDPRANVQSMMEVDFESRITASLAWRWKYYNKCIEQAKKMRPEQFYTVRYEDLVLHAGRELKNICAFLHVDFNESMLNFHRQKETAERRYTKEILEKYHSHLFVPVNDSRIHIWKEKLSVRQIRITEAVCRPFMLRYEYSMQMQGGRARYLFLAFPGMIYGRLYMLFGDFLNLLPYGIRMMAFKGLAAVFNPWWKKHQAAGDQRK